MCSELQGRVHTAGRSDSHTTLGEFFSKGGIKTCNPRVTSLSLALDFLDLFSEILCLRLFPVSSFQQPQQSLSLSLCLCLSRSCILHRAFFPFPFCFLVHLPPPSTASTLRHLLLLPQQVKVPDHPTVLSDLIAIITTISIFIIIMATRTEQRAI